MNPMQGLTLEFWFNPASWGPFEDGLARIIDKSNFYIYMQKNFIDLYNSNSIVFVMKDENNKKSRWCTPENSIVLNEWQHIAVTFSSESSEVLIYINGINQTLVSDGFITGTIKDNTSKDLYIGNGSSKTQNYAGIIDEVRLWDYARSATDIDTTMNSYLRGTEDGLLGYWRMNEDNGEILRDRTNYNNDGSVISSWVEGIVLEKPTGIQNEVTSQKPKKYDLFANYPNPFNLETIIKFSLKNDAQVSIKIFNILGQKMYETVYEKLAAGFHKLNFSAANIPSGVYFYMMEVNGTDNIRFVQTRKMAVIR